MAQTSRSWIPTPTEDWLYGRRGRPESCLDSVSLPVRRSSARSGPRATDLYMGFLLSRKIRRVAVQVPCFDGLFVHPSREGLDVAATEGPVVDMDADALVVSHPSNPAGSLPSPEELERLYLEAERRPVVVDAVMSPGFAMSHQDFPGLIVSSLWKVYGVPGSAFSTGRLSYSKPPDVPIEDLLPCHVAENREVAAALFGPSTVRDTWYGIVPDGVLKPGYGIPTSLFGTSSRGVRVSWGSPDFADRVTEALLP